MKKHRIDIAFNAADGRDCHVWTTGCFRCKVFTDDSRCWSVQKATKHLNQYFPMSRCPYNEVKIDATYGYGVSK